MDDAPPDARPALTVADLSTARLTLQPLDPARDATDLFEMDADPAVHTYDYGSVPSASIAATRRKLVKQLRQNGGASWVVSLHGDDTALGTIGVYADQGTTIRGLSWSLRRSQWGQGLMSEAAQAVVPYLLAQPGVDGLEAWADSRNIGSLKVAARAGLTERARLPRSYDDHVAQTVVMAIAAAPTDPIVFTVTPTLEVRDVEASAAVLRDVLDLRIAWSYGTPVAVAGLAIAPWTGSAGLHLQAEQGAVRIAVVTFEVGVSVDDCYRRAVAAGLEIVEPPDDRPWGRRDFTFVLAEGHRLSVSGATMPTAFR